MIHTVRPPVDPEAVREWARALPDDPAQIERAVLDRIRYAVPWQKDGVPWSFPAPAQIMATGYGDCQGRALIFASILAAKGIPFQLRASLDHMWVEYQGKRPSTLENDAKTLWMRRPATTAPAGQAAPGARPAPQSRTPGFQWRWPRVDLAESYRIEKEYFWDTAPAGRKLALFAGLAIIWWWRGARLRPWRLTWPRRSDLVETLA
jgi:hypothetical protein